MTDHDHDCRLPPCPHEWQPYYAVGLPWPPPDDQPHTSICIVCKLIRTDTEEHQ